MKVVLQDNVENLGVVGDIVRVRDGYARNYLIPRHLALQASERNVSELEHQKRLTEARRSKIEASAQELATKVNSLSISLSRAAGEDGKLFGSVTTMDLETALTEQGLSFSRKQILLTDPIKTMGDYEVSVKVSPGVQGVFKLSVVAEAS